MISVLVDRKFRLPRQWSNGELRRLAPLFSGDVVNVSGWEDSDKEGSQYRQYFRRAKSYSITNAPGERGFGDREGEIRLDLTQELPNELRGRFDVAFNHTTLEHIFDVRRAFSNLCGLSRDLVVIVVPFAQVQHETASWKDFWRFTPTCMQYLFHENGFSVVYEASSPARNSGIYILTVGSRRPEHWAQRLPRPQRSQELGAWIGERWVRRVAISLQRLFGRGPA